jgi:anti-sigma B factor antagonist
MLTIGKNIDNGTAVFNLEGRLDTITAPQLEQELKAVLEETKELVLDFAGLSYISSAGLRVLLWAQKAIGEESTMTVRNVDDAVMDIFDVTGFSEILTIEKAEKTGK